jgi:hypothetical protein
LLEEYKSYISIKELLIADHAYLTSAFLLRVIDGKGPGFIQALRAVQVPTEVTKHGS